VRAGAHYEDLVVGPLERKEHGVSLPHGKQAAAAVGEESDVEKVKGLADPAERHGRDAVRVIDRGHVGWDDGMLRLALGRDPGADAALHRHLATGFRLVTAGRSGTPCPPRHRCAPHSPADPPPDVAVDPRADGTRTGPGGHPPNRRARPDDRDGIT
jgi:hypothetical protein